MKLIELKTIIDRSLENARHTDSEVVVAVKMPFTTVGAIPTVPVDLAFNGFDWDNGKFILTPKENLTPADRDFAAQMKKMQEDLGWEKLENRRLKAEIKKLKKDKDNEPSS